MIVPATKKTPTTPYRFYSEPKRHDYPTWQAYLHALFDWQFATLIRKDYPKAASLTEQQFISQYFDPLKLKLSSISENEINQGNIPFLIVVKHGLVSVDRQMEMAEVDGKKGYNSLAPWDFLEIYDPAPSSSVFIAVNVENGRAMLNKSPNQAERLMMGKNRLSLIFEEGVALIVHYPDSLKSHFIILSSSRHGDGRVATLILHGDGPRLGWGWASCSDAKRGSASCLRRL